MFGTSTAVKHLETIIIFLILSINVCCYGNICSRRHSRIVRQILEEHFFNHYIDENTSLPESCAFKPSRDLYLVSEQHKRQDSATKWSCEFCGKAFMTEHTLDAHFDNRHSDKVLQADNSVCLADYCDFLRCDIVSGVRKPSYWDEALCKESEVVVLREKCEAMVKSCVPLTLIGTARYDFQRKIKESLCSYLTCEKYWEVPLKEGSAFGMTAYVVAVVLLFMLLIVYYFVVYSHFYTEHSLLDESDGLLKTSRHRHYILSPPGTYEMRQRSQTQNR
ncbi:uncharacterized protein LOC144438224 [Glandiceps talaboti]